MNLKEKIILITGSSSGIGQEIAVRFAQEGATVIINYNTNKAGAEETLTMIEKTKGRGYIIQANVSVQEDIERLFQTIISRFGSLHVLVNNAAIGTDKVPYMEAKKDDFKTMLDTNIVGPMLCAQQAIKIMEKQQCGKIINTSSIRGAEHGGRSIVYAATKAAINSFTKTLAKQVAPHIHVNAVAPGFVKTRSYDTMSKELVDMFISQTYLKRWVTTEEIADAFIFLAKNDAMTGQVLYVDAGFTLK